MHKNILALSITIICYGCSNIAVANDVNTEYADSMDQLSQSLNLQEMKNKIDKAKLDNLKLNNQIKKAKDGDFSNVEQPTAYTQTSASQPIYTPFVNNSQEDKQKTNKPKEGSPSFSLFQIYGVEDNLKALIQNNNEVLPVETGQVISGVWKVTKINPLEVILENKKTKQKIYLYPSTDPVMDIPTEDNKSR
ncbi:MULTISPECIES: hypothetical protein [Cysteiniphilum]|uniref:Type IV pilus biogenesis protein PilP n=1 Tax=Cysteiniphilum litorale TaxID=2056700 RepID=A0A8J2Z3M2_9GAMM|nr:MULTISPECIES: hypothetical protein [Cysteiniphilum]GGF92006.1 hypothetical protein GCM10010995_06470 [Cysteiniphilum litorale]